MRLITSDLIRSFGDAVSLIQIGPVSVPISDAMRSMFERLARVVDDAGGLLVWSPATGRVYRAHIGDDPSRTGRCLGCGTIVMSDGELSRNAGRKILNPTIAATATEMILMTMCEACGTQAVGRPDGVA
jgi:hypothetical protein